MDAGLFFGMFHLQIGFHYNEWSSENASSTINQSFLASMTKSTAYRINQGTGFPFLTS
jgi:hypothetical protein